VPTFAIVKGYEVSTGSQLAFSRVNSTGYYSLPVALSTAVIITVYFDYRNYRNPNGGSSFGYKDVTSLNLTTDKILNIVIPGGMYNGTVVDVNGLPVGSVTIEGSSYDKDNPNRYFFKNVMTSETGTFSVFLLESIPYNISFIPPTGERYIPKYLSSLTIDTEKLQTVTLSTGVILSGKVIIPYPTGVESSSLVVYGKEPSTFSTVSEVRANATGYYSLVIAPNSPTLIVVELRFYWNSNDMYGFIFKTVANVTLASDKTLNLVAPGSMWNGTVVDVNGTPISSVAISGLSSSVGYNLDLKFSQRNVEFFLFDVVTSTTGEFSVLVSESDLYNVTFTPPTGSPLPIQSRILTIDPTSHQTFVLQTILPSASPSKAPTSSTPSSSSSSTPSLAPPTPTVIEVVIQVSQVIINK
jgi:hypothetical protein